MSELIEQMETSGHELVGASALEITSIPDIAILKGSYPPGTDIEAEIRKGFGAFLSEIHQALKSTPEAETALELLWLTQPVENQPYQAKIRMFLIARAISRDKACMEHALNQLLSDFQSTLKQYRYSAQAVPMAQLHQLRQPVPASVVRAIVKDESLDAIQSPLLPACYHFDLLHACAGDMAAIVNSLIEHPNCALSFQLIPTAFSPEEMASIGQMSQLLTNLSRGMMSARVGNVSITSAQAMSEVYQYYQGSKNAPLFQYNILVYGDTPAVADISSKIYGHLAFDAQKAPVLATRTLAGAPLDAASFAAQPWLLYDQILHTDRKTPIFDACPSFLALARMPCLVTAEEATEFFRLPLGTDLVSAGLPVNDSARTSRTYSSNLINAGDLTIGQLKSSGTGDKIGISLKDLAKHMLVVGSPGSGKSTFSLGLLDRLWQDCHIPFLVIEPAKNEYRALVERIPDLQVFTPGKNFISPFVFNPFVPPKNVKLESYKSTLKTAFAAGVSMSTPLDKIFEETIHNCYSDFRWLDTYTVDDGGRIFNISDFIRCFQQTFDEIGYTGDAKNIGRAGVVRLKSLVNLFDNYFSIPIEDILKKPTVIELAAIENADEKALIISLLLLSILAYVNANYVGEGGLHNVILLEEAHVLLDASGNPGQGDANPSSIAQGLVKRMLAEIRSYGVGLIIADQSPRKVSADVVGLTDLKLVFRLVESADKQIVADSMNMSEAQVRRLSRLRPGEAFLFFNRLDEPEEIITPDYRKDHSISITLSDKQIRDRSRYWDSRRKQLRPYPECTLLSCCSETCDYNRRILAREISRRIFVRNFNAQSKDFAVVKKVFSQISRLVQDELNREPFTPELLACTKCQLWRRIKYGTCIPVSDKLIENSLKKS